MAFFLSLELLLLFLNAYLLFERYIDSKRSIIRDYLQRPNMCLVLLCCVHQATTKKKRKLVYNFHFLTKDFLYQFAFNVNFSTVLITKQIDNNEVGA